MTIRLEESSPLLSAGEIDELVRAAVCAGLGRKRNLLLAELPVLLRSELPLYPSPGDQMRSDLIELAHLNVHRALKMGRLDTHPLESWLRQAERLAGLRDEAGLFRESAEKVARVAPPLHEARKSSGRRRAATQLAERSSHVPLASGVLVAFLAASLVAIAAEAPEMAKFILIAGFLALFTLMRQGWLQLFALIILAIMALRGSDNSNLPKDPPVEGKEGFFIGLASRYFGTPIVKKQSLKRLRSMGVIVGIYSSFAALIWSCLPP